MSERSRVWDCFFFNDEIDLLEFRLKELAPAVDRFVIVEGDRGFNGEPKPLHFAEHRERFAAFDDKIVHVVATISANAATRADRENEQHSALRDALTDVGSRDLLLIGDVDELPRRELIGELRDHLTVPLRLEMEWSTYFANWVLPRRFLEGPFALRGNQTRHRGVRSLLGDPLPYDPDYRELVLASAGRHISGIGDPQIVSDKFGSYMHHEFDNPRDRDLAHLERCFRYGVHYEGRWLVKRLDEGQLDPMLQRMRAFRAEWFNFEPPAARWRSWAYRSYTWLRREVSAAERFLVVFDRHPDAITGSAAPLFVALDAALQLRRKLWPKPEHWKMWWHADVAGRPLLT